MYWKFVAEQGIDGLIGKYETTFPEEGPALLLLRLETAMKQTQRQKYSRKQA